MLLATTIFGVAYARSSGKDFGGKRQALGLVDYKGKQTVFGAEIVRILT